MIFFIFVVCDCTTIVRNKEIRISVPHELESNSQSLVVIDRLYLYIKCSPDGPACHRQCSWPLATDTVSGITMVKGGVLTKYVLRGIMNTKGPKQIWAGTGVRHFRTSHGWRRLLYSLQWESRRIDHRFYAEIRTDITTWN